MIRVLLILLLLVAECTASAELRSGADVRSIHLREPCQNSSDPLSCADKLLRELRSQGYLLANASINISAADTMITLNSGKRYTYGDLRIAGVPDSVINKIISEFSSSDPLTTEHLKTLAERILNYFAEGGYPFCKLELESLGVSSDSVIVSFSLVTGPLTDIGAVDYYGLKVTRPRTLTVRTGLTTGSRYRESDLRRATRTLENLTFCSLTGSPQVLFNSRERNATIRFPLRERRNISFDGLLFLNPDNSLAGSVDVTLLNLLGGGRELDLNWSRRGVGSQRLNFGVTLPYFSGLPIDIALRLSQEDRDSSFISVAMVGVAEYRVSDSWKVGFTTGWEKITPEEGRTTPSARELSLGAVSTLDRRDQRERTTGGTWLRSEFVSSFRRSFGTSKGTVSGYSTRLDLDIRHWRQLVGGLLLYLRAYAFQISSDFDPLPLDQLTQIGGVGTIRGYRESSFLADIGVVSSVELRYLVADQLTLRLFSDNGLIRQKRRDTGLTGYGAGFEVRTSIGLLDFDLSLGEEKSLDKLLVHFGFRRGL